MSEPTFTSDWFSHNIPAWEATVTPHLRQIDRPRILEIGVFEGRSTVWLLDNFPAAHLTAIDPWAYTDGADEVTYERFMSNIRPYSDRVKVIRGKSQIARTFPEKEFDLVYVDGDHRAAAVLHDAVIAFEILKPGGLIIFDDYLGGDHSINYPKPAIDLFHDAYGAMNRIKLVSDAYQRIYKKLAD